jgi:hypothetical protein
MKERRQFRIWKKNSIKIQKSEKYKTEFLEMKSSINQTKELGENLNNKLGQVEHRLPGLKN